MFPGVVLGLGTVPQSCPLPARLSAERVSTLTEGCQAPHPRGGSLARQAWGRRVPTLSLLHSHLWPLLLGSGFKLCQEPGVSMLSLLPRPLR